MMMLTLRQGLASRGAARRLAPAKAEAPTDHLQRQPLTTSVICRFARASSALRVSLAGLGLILTGCVSSQVPQAIRETPVNPISVSEAQRKPESFPGRRVRWGGTIIGVRNQKRATEIEVLSRPLSSRGEPLEKKSGEGRFIALLSGFADPAEYPKERQLTVAGRLTGVRTRPVGEYPYPYPVVQVEQIYLWPKLEANEPPYYYPDPWYDPWYGPWYPWGWPRYPWGWGPYY